MNQKSISQQARIQQCPTHLVEIGSVDRLDRVGSFKVESGSGKSYRVESGRVESGGDESSGVVSHRVESGS